MTTYRSTNVLVCTCITLLSASIISTSRNTSALRGRKLVSSGHHICLVSFIQTCCRQDRWPWWFSTRSFTLTSRLYWFHKGILHKQSQYCLQITFAKASNRFYDVILVFVPFDILQFDSLWKNVRNLITRAIFSFIW